MPTRNVVLTDHQERFIAEMVGSGRYRNASEVLREALRLIERREMEDCAKLEALREAARIGISAIERGDFRTFDRIDDLEAHLDQVGELAIETGRRHDTGADA
ncbi:MAG: type II toxin-antitoxin system ParD family antitoxin [Nitrococcus sp.]|nr:type II toxin-antitoxin system ParD family antitoxin [Nitrococcus sp.]